MASAVVAIMKQNNIQKPKPKASPTATFNKLAKFLKTKTRVIKFLFHFFICFDINILEQ